jgi:hypothetical protein
VHVELPGLSEPFVARRGQAHQRLTETDCLW